MNSIEIFVNTAHKKAESDLAAAKAEFVAAQTKLREMTGLFEQAELALHRLKEKKLMDVNPRIIFLSTGFNYVYCDPETGKPHIKREGWKVNELEFPRRKVNLRPGDLVKEKMEELNVTIRDYYVQKKEYDLCLSVEGKLPINEKIHKLLANWVIMYDIIDSRGCIGYEDVYQYELRLMEHYKKTILSEIAPSTGGAASTSAGTSTGA